MWLCSFGLSYMSLNVCLCLPRWLVSATTEVRLVFARLTLHVLIHICSLTLNTFLSLTSETTLIQHLTDGVNVNSASLTPRGTEFTTIQR